MDRYEKLMKRSRENVVILMDGATGTEVERRGVAQLHNAWNGGAALFQPETVRAVHQDYIRHGAELIISNTFANAQHALDDAGVGEDFEKFNAVGVQLAIEARDSLNADHVCVAGGISYWTWTGKKPSLSKLRESVTTQAQIMKEKGVDLLILEMMIDIDQMLVTFEAARKSDLPIWVGLTCKLDDEGRICLQSGDSLESAIEVLIDAKPDVIHIMHTEVLDVLPALQVLKDYWSGPIGVYAHSGKVIDQKWVFNDVISPEHYQNYVECWLQHGVTFIGGCCGINVDHISLLNEKIIKKSY